MTRFLLWRLVMAFLLLFIVSFATFILIAIAPGDPAAALLGASATPERIALVHSELGLDKPLLVRYWDWLTAFIRGDLGQSVLTQQSVSQTIGQRMLVTVSLVVFAFVLSTAGGLVIGLWSAVRGGWMSAILEKIAIVMAAIPPFWLGYLLIRLFAFKLNLLPATGYIPPTESLAGWLLSLVLPVATLIAVPLMGIAKQTRDSMQEVMAREYIVALRADGMSERRVLWRHALRNASIPIVTLAGLYFVGMLGGTVFAESVFSLPGLGSLVVESAQAGDFPMVQGVVVVLCIGVILINIIVDLLYGWLNPKARPA